MKLTFIGAAHEVTGSCHLLQAAGKNILIDCGMEQGPDLYENPGLPIAAGEVDYVFLTHAHIDHSGLLPLLCKNGFKGQIIDTFATADLCNIMLRDSTHIQEFEAEWRNRKGRRAGVPEFEPLYVMADAEAAINLFVPCGYGERLHICDGVEIRFTDVGHLLVRQVLRSGLPKVRLAGRSYFQEMWGMWISRSSKIQGVRIPQIMW